MWTWLVQNKQWVFDGFGVVALTTVLGGLWWLGKKFWKREPAIVTPQAPTTIAPSIVMNPTINVPIEAIRPELPKAVVPAPVISKARPNLCVEDTMTGKIALQGDIWTLRPGSTSRDRPRFYRALLADISNVPTSEIQTAKAEIRAGIRMDYGGRVRTYSPLPWLEEYRNLMHLETGSRKTVVLAVGEDSQTGAWSFVLNHRKDYYTSNAISQMDFSNACPIPSDLPFEILMIDINSGALIKTFAYLWTFDAENNWPILKPV